MKPWRLFNLAAGLLLLIVLFVPCADLHAVLIAAPLKVTNTNNSGPGSLRQAILDSNANIGFDTIHFQIPVPGDPVPDPGCNNQGVCTITPSEALPGITDPVSIDGYTQTGATPNTLLEGDDAQLKIEISGANAEPGVENGDDPPFGVELPSGLKIAAGGAGSLIRGLIINRFSDAGIKVRKSPGNIIQGNFIGTDATGALSLGNVNQGIRLEKGSDETLIGGANPEDRNLISGNGGDALDATGTIAVFPGPGITIDLGADHNQVLGNFIGTDASGTKKLGSDEHPGNGIEIGSSNNQIGSFCGVTPPVPSQISPCGNLISGNAGDGIVLAKADNNQIQGNLIGTNITGTKDLGNGASGILVASSNNNLIGGLSANHELRNIISGNGSDKIRLRHSSNNQIQDNFIGTDITGTRGLQGGDDLSIAIEGIQIDTDSNDNLIGGSEFGAGNLISGHYDGISIEGSHRNKIQGNLIGTDFSGAAPLANQKSGNQGVGISVNSDSSDTLIGGPEQNAANVISNNFLGGIEDAFGHRTKIQGNFIGMDSTGTPGAISLGNRGSGIIIDTSEDTLIGGTNPHEGNVVSGNDGVGIAISDSKNCKVQGNLVGTDITGILPLGNKACGVGVNGEKTLIGGANPAARNIISANKGCGVVVSGSQNQIQGNFIGTDITGINELGNTQGGVVVSGEASDNVIGGKNPGEGNTIMFNGFVGLAIVGASANGNFISSNAIFSNEGLGIDLSLDTISSPVILDGITVNDFGDADTGPNGLQNFPEIESFISGGGITQVTGTLNSTPDTAFRLEFFSNTTPDPSNHGEGEKFLGAQDVETDASGNASFNTVFALEVPAGQSVSTTATKKIFKTINGSPVFIERDTSEFSGKKDLGEPLPPCTVLFGQSDYVVQENVGNAVITLFRVGGCNISVDVDFSTSNGSAIDKSDYQKTLATLHWDAADAPSKTVNVPVINDQVTEPNENVVLTLSNASNGANIVSSNPAKLIILDDDKVEICGNGQDDDADGTTDCLDSDCTSDVSCQTDQEQPPPSKNPDPEPNQPTQSSGCSLGTSTNSTPVVEITWICLLLLGATLSRRRRRQ